MIILLLEKIVIYAIHRLSIIDINKLKNIFFSYGSNDDQSILQIIDEKILNKMFIKINHQMRYFLINFQKKMK